VRGYKGEDNNEWRGIEKGGMEGSMLACEGVRGERRRKIREEAMGR
jgi:hypothetical protein